MIKKNNATDERAACSKKEMLVKLSNQKKIVCLIERIQRNVCQFFSRS